jgi:hypothetical protein
LKFLLQLLQQAASSIDMKLTVAAIGCGASLANGGSSDGGGCC